MRDSACNRLRHQAARYTVMAVIGKDIAMLDRKTEKKAPAEDPQAPLSDAQKRVRKKKEDALQSGNLNGWPTKAEQNGWKK